MIQDLAAQNFDNHAGTVNEPQSVCKVGALDTHAVRKPEKLVALESDGGVYDQNYRRRGLQFKDDLQPDLFIHAQTRRLQAFLGAGHPDAEARGGKAAGDHPSAAASGGNPVLARQGDLVRYVFNTNVTDLLHTDIVALAENLVLVPEFRSQVGVDPDVQAVQTQVNQLTRGVTGRIVGIAGFLVQKLFVALLHAGSSFLISAVVRGAASGGVVSFAGTRVPRSVLQLLVHYTPRAFNLLRGNKQKVHRGPASLQDAR